MYKYNPILEPKLPKKQNKNPQNIQNPQKYFSLCVSKNLLYSIPHFWHLVIFYVYLDFLTSETPYLAE